MGNARRRYDELKREGEDASGVVPDPNHHNVINISSDEEYDDHDVFKDAVEDLDMDDDVVPSRFFTTQPAAGDDDSNDYRPSPPARSGSKPPRRQTSKKPRRRSGTESRPRAKTPKPKGKYGGRSASQSSSRKGTKSKPSQSTSRMELMPI